MGNASYNITIETASALFSQRGIKSISIDEIARACMVSKKIFYENFADKEKLVDVVVQNILIRDQRQIETLKGTSLNAIEEMINFFQYVQANMYVFTLVFVRDLEKYYPGIHAMLQHTEKNRLAQYLKKNLQRGLQEGIYRKGLDTESAGKLYYWQVKNAMSDSSLRVEDRHNLLGYINSFFLQGILNQKGMKQAVIYFKNKNKAFA